PSFVGHCLCLLPEVPESALAEPGQPAVSEAQLTSDKLRQLARWHRAECRHARSELRRQQARQLARSLPRITLYALDQRRYLLAGLDPVEPQHLESASEGVARRRRLDSAQPPKLLP